MSISDMWGVNAEFKKVLSVDGAKEEFEQRYAEIHESVQGIEPTREAMGSFLDRIGALMVELAEKYDSGADITKVKAISDWAKENVLQCLYPPNTTQLRPEDLN